LSTVNILSSKYILKLHKASRPFKKIEISFISIKKTKTIKVAYKYRVCPKGLNAYEISKYSRP
jgi:hypothetical protein